MKTNTKNLDDPGNALTDELVWNFPGQPPSVRPFGGRCGYVANEPAPGTAQAGFLALWRAQSMPVANTMAAIHATAPAAIQGELGHLSPAAQAFLEARLQEHVRMGYDRCDEERAVLMPRRV